MNITCSVIEVIDIFISEQSVSQISRQIYRMALMKFFSFITGSDVWNPGHNIEVRTVTTPMIIDFKDDQNTKHCSEYSTALYIAVLKRFFRWTASKGIHDNVALNVRSPRRQRGLCKDPLTLEQATVLMASIERSTSIGKRNYAIVALLLYNGLRGIEVQRINNKDIVKEGDITYIYVQGKGHVNKDDKVALCSGVLKAINHYQSTKVGYENDDPLFVAIGRRNMDNRISLSLIKKIVLTQLVVLGFKTDRISTHSLRHTAASLLIHKGDTMPNIKKFMRHSSYTVTERYIQQIEEMNKANNESTELLAKLIPFD